MKLSRPGAARAPAARWLLALMPLSVLSMRAESVNYTVGPGCTYATVAAALQASQGLDFLDTQIRVRANAGGTGQALVLEDRTLRIVGGLAECDSAEASGATILSGFGASTSVITIRGQTDVTLENLWIIAGDDTGSDDNGGSGGGHGGGIDMRGRGYLELVRTRLFQNEAVYGGGINIAASGGEIDAVFGPGTHIDNNTAMVSGGGIRIEGITRLTMEDEDSGMVGNAALEGYGGAVLVLGSARADIGAPGYVVGGVRRATFHENVAEYGGAVAAFSVGSGAPSVRLYSTLAAVPIRLHLNRARRNGGAIFVGGSGSNGASVCVEDFRIDANFAQEGSAIYVDASDSSDRANLRLNLTQSCSGSVSRPIEAAVRCTPGPNCNAITHNRTEDVNGTPTPGAAILVRDNGILWALMFRLRNNFGAQALRAINASFQVLSRCELIGNQSSDALIRTSGSQELVVGACTIGGNQIGGPAVLALGGGLAMEESVIAQPGKISASGSGTRDVIDVVATERDSLDGGNTPFVVEADPRLMDVENGDARLHPASLAVDHADIRQPPGQRDLAGEPIDLDMAAVPNRFGPRDLGAYEVQEFGNLVRNAEFRLPSECVASPTPAIPHWTPVTPGALACSVEGFQSTDAIYVRQDSPTTLCDTPAGPRPCVLGPRTCVPLPAPGGYRLNGQGRSTGALAAMRDYPRLFWRLRGASADCSGPDLASGILYLPRGTNWAPANSDAVFELQPAQWSTNSSLEIALQVVDGDDVGTNLVDGYFDAIRLSFAGDQNFAPYVTAPIAARSDPEGATVAQPTAPSFADPNGDALTFSAQSLPPGLGIDAASGDITGTLAQGSAGQYTVRVIARDIFNAGTQLEFGWTVTGSAIFADGFE